MNNIGQRVRALRKKLGITQQQLANRIGFVRNYISLVENGRRPSHRFVRALELIEQAPMPNIGHASVIREEPFAGFPRGLIKARRKELGLSLEDLARLTGCRKSTLYNVEEGHARADEKLLKKLSKHLDIPIEDLKGRPEYSRAPGVSYSLAPESNDATRTGVTVQVIPLLTWAEAGTTEAWDDLYGRAEAVGFNLLDPNAVAVQIRGDGMEPQFPQGTIAIVYPGTEAKSGDLVIARLNDGTVMFTRLHVDGDYYTFISLNSIYPPRRVEKSKIAKLLPVGGTYQNHL